MKRNRIPPPFMSYLIRVESCSSRAHVSQSKWVDCSIYLGTDTIRVKMHDEEGDYLFSLSSGELESVSGRRYED